MIDMSKMNKILGYDLENFVVRVEPGVLLNDLAEDAQKQGLLYPPDPGEKFATLGGNVSTNAGGMRAVKYGCTRDYVRAMTVVLPTGEIVKLGATVSKTSTGYSLLGEFFQLFHVVAVECHEEVSADVNALDLFREYALSEVALGSENDLFLHEFQCLRLEVVHEEFRNCCDTV